MPELMLAFYHWIERLLWTFLSSWDIKGDKEKKKMRKVAREFSPGVIRQSSSLSFQPHYAISLSRMYIHSYTQITHITHIERVWYVGRVEKKASVERREERGGVISLFSALLVPRMWTTMTNRETMLGATGKIPKNANNKNESLRSFCLVGGSAGGGVSGEKKAVGWR